VHTVVMDINYSETRVSTAERISLDSFRCFSRGSGGPHDRAGILAITRDGGGTTQRTTTSGRVEQAAECSLLARRYTRSTENFDILESLQTQGQPFGCWPIPLSQAPSVTRNA
jgi:hypothetical protein